MGWGNCGEVNGREVGYLVDAECDHDGCAAEIHRGLGYVCGRMHGDGEAGCGNHYCPDHEYDHNCEYRCDMAHEAPSCPDEHCHLNEGE